MDNGTQTIVTGAQKPEEQNGVLSKIKGFFQKSQNSSGGQKNRRLDKSFHFSRRDSIISVLIAVVVVGGAIYYGKTVLDEYSDLNSRADELKQLSAYSNVSLDVDKISSYVEGDNPKTIDELVSVNTNIELEVAKNEAFKDQQKKYYEILLQNIYLPSLNVWKDPYTENFDMSVLGEKYLETDKFQDLYLIQYWTDFAKEVGKGVEYNTVDKIEIGDKTVLEENPEYFYIPVTIKFSSPNKRSFLLLVNKLSMTSNQSNISLLNEFFFNLLEAIKQNKSSEIDQLMKEYLEEFSSSSSWEYPLNLGEFTEEQLSDYRDKVIGYNLYHWINGGGTRDVNQLIDNSIVEKAIMGSASCSDTSNLTQKCLYDFREKYRNLPYLAYEIGLENQNNRTKGLLGFLKILPPAIAIKNFGFEKYSTSSFLNNDEERYEGSVTFNAYGRNILDSELDEAGSMLGKLCFGNNSDLKISPEVALKYVNEVMVSLGGNREYSNVSSLLELQKLFTSIQESYDGMSNYDKMVKLFEIWRMMNDANLCNK